MEYEKAKMAISVAMVKKLREKTGAGMMDCKKALIESDGDMETSIDWLRANGISSAARKAGRVASEGLIGIASDGTNASVIEINSETDFVARNELFQKLVSDTATVALISGGDTETVATSMYPGSDHSVDVEIREVIATIGENINLRRVANLSVTDGVVAHYMHNTLADGLGKIGVLVALESSGDKDALFAIGRQVAMHIAASNPLALTPDDVDSDVADRERSVYAEQARASGKPDNIIEKMVEGRMRKFYEEVVLLKQAFVIDPVKTVEKAIKDAEADVGAPIKTVAFVRMALGDGIDQEETDVAVEVAATSNI